MSDDKSLDYSYEPVAAQDSTTSKYFQKLMKCDSSVLLQVAQDAKHCLQVLGLSDKQALKVFTHDEETFESDALTDLVSHALTARWSELDEAESNSNESEPGIAAPQMSGDEYNLLVKVMEASRIVPNKFSYRQWTRHMGTALIGARYLVNFELDTETGAPSCKVNPALSSTQELCMVQLMRTLVLPSTTDTKASSTNKPTEASHFEWTDIEAETETPTFASFFKAIYDASPQQYQGPRTWMSSVYSAFFEPLLRVDSKSLDEVRAAVNDSSIELSKLTTSQLLNTLKATCLFSVDPEFKEAFNSLMVLERRSTLDVFSTLKKFQGFVRDSQSGLKLGSSEAEKFAMMAIETKYGSDATQVESDYERAASFLSRSKPSTAQSSVHSSAECPICGTLNKVSGLKVKTNHPWKNCPSYKRVTGSNNYRQNNKNRGFKDNTSAKSTETSPPQAQPEQKQITNGFETATAGNFADGTPLEFDF